MAGINKVIFVGNLGKDPEIRSLDNGVKVASYRLGTPTKAMVRTALSAGYNFNA